MTKRIGIVLLSMLVLAGCGRRDDGTEANESGNPGPAMLESTNETVEAAETLVAVVPTKLGDAAYPLTELTWIKGEPVTIAPGKVYVVEFWATWCPPCVKSIPHLTELQAKYGDQVMFVGVSNEDADTVKPFVAEKGSQMAYTVAVDPAGKVIDGYMRAFGQGGIPTAFVVDTEGRVVWLGHPMGDLETVLDRVLAGTYTIPG